MERVDRPWKRGVVLVCTNTRSSERASCGPHGAARLRHLLKERCRAAGGPLGEVRVLGTSCLNICPERGVAVALEPGGRCWVVDAETDVEPLLETLRAELEAGGARAAARRLVGRLKR